MSVHEWGTLKEPTLAVPEPSEPSESSRRAARTVEDGLSDGETLSPYSPDRWRLPGYGKSGDGCGEWFPASVCDECGHLDLGQHRCGRRTCPDCWTMWADEAAVRAAVRVQSFRHVQPDGPLKQAAHAVISPSDGEIKSERQFYAGRKRAAEMAEQKGWRGFAVVPHPWRATEATKRQYKRIDPDVGLWVWLRREFDETGIKQRTKWSPHYHIIGATSPNMDAADESDEWVYHFIDSLKHYGGARDGESHEATYGAFRYLLSHTGWPDGSTKQAITWYGEMANSVFVEDASEAWQVQQPSDGVQSVIKRTLEERTGVDADESDESDGVSEDTDDEGACPCDGCDGRLIGTWDIRDYLMHNQPPPDVTERMRVAADWRHGDVQPPAGMRKPQSQEQAIEAFEAMLSDS